MELGLSLGQDNEHEFLNLCSRCVMTLGMLSWSMATIQDHRSYMLRKKHGKQPRNKMNIPKIVQQVCSGTGKSGPRSKLKEVTWWHRCPCGPGSMSMQALGIEHPKVGLR